MKMSDWFDLPLSNTDYLLYSADVSEEPVECRYSGDAKAIAHAVNHHDALVGALKGMLVAIELGSNMEMFDAEKRARAILEKVKQ